MYYLYCGNVYKPQSYSKTHFCSKNTHKHDFCPKDLKI